MRGTTSRRWRRFARVSPSRSSPSVARRLRSPRTQRGVDHPLDRVEVASLETLSVDEDAGGSLDGGFLAVLHVLVDLALVGVRLDGLLERLLVEAELLRVPSID